MFIIFYILCFYIQVTGNLYYVQNAQQTNLNSSLTFRDNLCSIELEIPKYCHLPNVSLFANICYSVIHKTFSKM